MVFRLPHTSPPGPGLYESDWTRIDGSDSASFTHELGEIPWTADVASSSYSDGSSPSNANAGVTVAKTETTITVTNNGTDSLYFRVRAM